MTNHSFLYDVQNQIADILNEELKDCKTVFLAEDSKTVDYEIKNALGKQGIVGLVMTPKASYIGNLDNRSLAWELQIVIEVVENPSLNRGRPEESFSGQTVAMKSLEALSNPATKMYEKFCPVSYEQGEDGGLLVNKVVVKCTVCLN